MTDQENDIKWREYFYPGTDILINNYDCKDKDELKEIETNVSFDRLVELMENPLDYGFDKNHLKMIHKYIFEDIYPFAGQYRNVNMGKAKGTFLFIDKPSDIDEYLDELFEETNNRLNSCHGKFEFSEILANLYTKLIFCHPFREGNGRSIREFTREFSIEKSKEIGIGTLELDWRKIDKEELNRYIEVAHLFPGQTAILFESALMPVESKVK